MDIFSRIWRRLGEFFGFGPVESAGPACPTWEEFITAVLPDEADRETLREWLRTLLSGGKPDKGLFLFSSGRTGTTTMLNAIRMAVAEKGIKTMRLLMSDPDALGQRGWGEITGVGLVVAAYESTSRKASSTIRRLLSGDILPARTNAGVEKKAFQGGLIVTSNRPPATLSPSVLARLIVLRPQRVERFANVSSWDIASNAAEDIPAWGGV